MGVSPSFVELLKLHEVLDEMFTSHQEALLSMDVELASEILKTYRTALLHHMEDEEKLLLPLYEERAGKIPGGPVELFLGEHKKMRAFIAGFEDALGRMQRENKTGLKRWLIALLDRQCMYKHLVEHHDLREKNILYPWLDRLTSADERLELLGQCRRSHEPC